MAGPIKPTEVQGKKNAALPEEVFTVFNELIVANWDGHAATIKQKEAATRVALAMNISMEDVYACRLLDVEDAYRQEGWKVEYDKPGYNESYEAFFTFAKKSS